MHRQQREQAVLRVVQRRDDVDIRARVCGQAVVRDAELVQEQDDVFERVGEVREECEGVGCAALGFGGEGCGEREGVGRRDVGD